MTEVSLKCPLNPQLLPGHHGLPVSSMLPVIVCSLVCVNLFHCTYLVEVIGLVIPKCVKSILNSESS